MTTAVGTYVGEWVNIASARDIEFWFRMQSAGSPLVKLSVDVSFTKPFPTTLNAMPPPSATQPSEPFDPSSNYKTYDLDPAFSTVFNGSDANGGWTEITPPASMKDGFAHYSSMRYRCVVTVANITAADLVFTRAAR